MPLPAGPYRAIFSAALRAWGFWKVVIEVVLWLRSCEVSRKSEAPGREPRWLALGPVYALRGPNRPGPALVKRARSPFIAISRAMAL